MRTELRIAGESSAVGYEEAFKYLRFYTNQ